MRAWLLEGPRRLALREVPSPAALHGEVLVKIRYVGLCGSDIEIYKGNRAPEASHSPLILGHEASGVIEECGEGVHGFTAGDRVVLRGVWGCCAEYAKARVTSPPHPGAARFIQVVRIPPDIPEEGSSLLEVLPKVILASELAAISPQSDVVILGQGVTGLLLTQAVNLKSPHRLLTVDLFEEKLALSRSFGATHTLRREAGRPVEGQRDILPDGADVVFPAHLSGGGVPEAIELLKWRGKLVLWGCLGKAEVDFFRLHARGADILATQMNDLAQDAEYGRKAIEYIRSGLIRIGGLTTHTFPFERMPEAFRIKEEPRADVLHVLVKTAE